MRETLLQNEQLKKEISKTKIDFEQQLDTEKSLNQKIVDLQNRNLNLQAKVKSVLVFYFEDSAGRGVQEDQLNL